MKNQRNYKREYEVSHSSPKAKKQRAKNNKARRKLIRLGRASKGDGKDVAHKDNNTSNNSSSNLSLQSKSKNRSFKRNSSAKRARSFPQSKTKVRLGSNL